VVSVVIPAFNASRFIRRAIDSVLAQTYRDFELIVVDDGSTDDTGDVVRSYGKEVRYIYQENAGDGPARNTGIEAARGQWIAFLDHDDEWLPRKLELQMALLDRNPELHWCGANRYQSDAKRRVLAGEVRAIKKALAGKDYFGNYFRAAAKGVCPIISSTMVVRKKVFEEIGTFDSCWLRCADLDMWWRIACRFPRIGYLPEPLVVMHLEVQDLASTKLRLLTKRGEESRKLIARHLELSSRYGTLEDFKLLARKTLRSRLVTTIYHGYKKDARRMVNEFNDLFPWYWRGAAYLLTVFPRATSWSLRGIAYMRWRFGLERDVSRRWVSLKDAQEKAEM